MSECIGHTRIGFVAANLVHLVVLMAIWKKMTQILKLHNATTVNPEGF